jgi:hypothetical protein
MMPNLLPATILHFDSTRADPAMSTKMRLAIILPVFNDAPSLVVLIQKLAAVFKDCVDETCLVIVDDGSLPPLREVIDTVIAPGLVARLLTLTRNFGHQRAIAIGLAYAVGNHIADAVLVMDADGEDMPQDTLRLIKAIGNNDRIVAVARRQKRSERALFRGLYQLYRFIFLILTGVRISFGNFSAMRLGVARRLSNMSELWTSLPAAILRSRVPIIEVPTERGTRYHGSPHMKLVSLVELGFSTISAFLDRALTRIILAASAVVVFCVICSISAIVIKLAGVATPGWMTTVMGVSLILMFGVLLLSLVGLLLSIASNTQVLLPPSIMFDRFIADVTIFDSDGHRLSDGAAADTQLRRFSVWASGQVPDPS